MSVQKELGQFFTKSIILKEKVNEFILNNTDKILEPSVGRGDLVEYILQQRQVTFDLYEIDSSIEFLDCVDNITFGDFLKQDIIKKYKTIIGNPPFVRTKKGNLYVDFVDKCFELLEENGELIFIVPSDFLKLTFSKKTTNKMLDSGTFTHIYYPHKENLFEEAVIDVMVFRYCKNIELIGSKTIINGEGLFLINCDGFITFAEKQPKNLIFIKDCFDVNVGFVSGKESVLKNKLGNIEIFVEENKTEKYICITNFPTENEILNEYMLKHKDKLIQRKIRKFNEKNWFEFGALRNLKFVKNNIGKDCIYLQHLSRRKQIAFIGKVRYFGYKLFMIVPKKEKTIEELQKIVDFFNGDKFRKQFTYAGKFKTGHRQLCNSLFNKD